MRTPQPFSLVSTRPARLAAGIAAAVLLAFVGLAGTARAKPFEDYIKPMPPVAPLSSASWGAAALPRDLSNGIESAMGAGVHPQWYYWDGQIIKAKDGKYHMFMSTFDANSNFGTAWQGSDAYHAISETNVLGPYVRKDYVYSTSGSTPHKGHNVSAAELPDGTYAVIVGEVVPFQIFKSSSLDGPWTGCSPQSDIGASNVSMFPRHDGKYQIVERHGTIAISDTLCGHYVKQKPTCAYTQSSDAADTIYPKRTSIPGVSNPAFTWQEDPHIWRSGGTYHVVYSGSGDRVGWHLYSPDGLSWKDNGYAWSPRDYQKIFCYEGSTTCNAWYKMERPGVVLQDGHPTHMTWAVSDVDKDNQVTPGTNHGTKVIVVPFDGVAFDNDFGTGGGSGTGGASGTGGTSGTGGVSGRGGAGGGAGGAAGGADGGTAGAGGNASDAGRDGTGSGASGGSSGPTGGTTSAGGATNSDAANSSGGKTGTGGATSAGGATGGSSSAGGTTSTSSGGTQGSGGLASGGTQGGAGGSGGTSSGSGGQGGGNSSSTSTTPVGTPSSGCACTLQGRERATWSGPLLLIGFALLSLRRLRRSARTR